MATQKQPKASKGTVSIEVFQGRLRLRWRYLGKRYCLPVGMPDGVTARKIAQTRANNIEIDMARGEFDSTLAKYKFHTGEATGVSVVALFEQFIAYKGKRVSSSRTLEKYRATLKDLKLFYESQEAKLLDFEGAEEFFHHLKSKGLEIVTYKERIGLLKACWEWGKGNDLVDKNPWADVLKCIRVPEKQMPKPFTSREMEAIIKEFRQDKRYGFYADYVTFLFGTGCRVSEVIGLQWKHVKDDCSSVWIGESLSRGVRKSTKTNRARTVPMTPRLTKMLLSRRSENYDPEGLVFPAPRGGAIDDGNFRNRGWKTILDRLGIEYRKPYSTRHTFVSHALEGGMKPTEVARLTGHRVKTLYDRYAGCVKDYLELPDLLSTVLNDETTEPAK